MSEHSEPGSEGSDAESMDKSWQLERSDASQEDLDGSMSDTDPVSATQLDTLFGPQYILDANYATVTGANVPSPCAFQALDPRKRSHGKAWMKVASVPTRYLYQWFEYQRNDYTSHDQTIADCVRLFWVGHPGDSPRDVSARLFSVEFVPEASKKDQASLRREKGVVFRHHFECKGMCNVSKRSAEDACDDDDDSDSTKKPRSKRIRVPACTGDVRIMIEVYADDLSKCVIYQRGSHPPASDEHYLQYSRRIRLYLMERGSQSGMTPSKLRLEMQQGLSGLGDAGALPRMFVRPEWRLPTTQQVDRVIAGLRRAVRLHSDPFVAVDLFVGLNPNLIFAYEPLVVTSTRKQFSVGIKSSWSIQNLIRWQGHTVCLDSSWRNKNENRAPLTFVTTTNAASHMVPCAAFLSADITSASLQHLLEALEDEVLAEARAICDKDDQKGLRKQTEVKVLVMNARKIVEAGSWRPASVMIDKCRAEFNALQSNKPEICKAFREAQRCSSLDDWAKYLQTFETRIKEVLKSYPAATVTQVLKYFATNWWCTPWHALVTDVGLQAGQTRDGINTNNTIERAFKTFDEIFLACRVNKRVDRLVQVLACDWLVYYELYSSGEPRLSPKDRKTMLDAHHLWETQAVVPVGTSGTSFCVRGSDVYNGASEPKHTWYLWHRLTSDVHARGGFKAASSVLTCMPLGYSQPWAACFNAKVLHEQEGVAALRNANLKLSSSTISDAKLDSELEEVLRVLSLHKDTSSASSALPQSETASRSTSTQAASLERGGGRPAKITPLHQRSKASSKQTASALRFSQKPGPTRTTPWIGKHIAPSASSSSASKPSLTTLAVGTSGPLVMPRGSSTPIATKNELERQIANMDEGTALRVQVSSFASTHLVQADFKGLRPGAWLTGTTIMLFAQHVHHSNLSRTRSVSKVGLHAQRTFLASCDLFQSPCSEQMMSKRVDEWYPAKSLMNYEQIIVPVNFSNTHWATIIVKPSERSILLVDSSPSAARQASAERFFRTFLAQRAEMELGKGHDVPSEALQRDTWNFAYNTAEDSNFPQQDDGHSCGLITCKVIEAALKGKQPTWKACSGMRAQILEEQEALTFRSELFLFLKDCLDSS
ncbi:hypothetical protein CF336_g4474 [Tilletia laevis]|nr:hypothetical protein CF336_g4474 [Tilletia laevis]